MMETKNKVIRIAFAGASWFDLTNNRFFDNVVKYVNDHGYIVDNEHAVIPSLVTQFWYK